MLVLLNYALNYASTIYQSLLQKRYYRQRKNPRSLHENIDKCCQGLVCLRPEPHVQPRGQRSVLRRPRRISVINPSFRKPIPARRVQRTRWIPLASMARLSRPFWCWQVERERSERLELCCHHGLCVTNCYFKCKELCKVSLRHPSPATGTSLTSSSPGVRTTAAFFTGVATTAQTMTRIIPLSAAKSS